MIDLDIWKAGFGAVALGLTFVAFLPYIRSILREEVRPHVFSWVIWGLGTVTVFVAQLDDGGGFGAWVIGVSGLITLSIAFLAWHQGASTRVAGMDWVFLALALTALLSWIATSDALLVVLILTLVDLLGFGPSVRKAYWHPDEEDPGFFLIGAVRNGFVLLALESYSAITVSFPAAIGAACLGFAVFILVRRRTLQAAPER